MKAKFYGTCGSRTVSRRDRTEYSGNTTSMTVTQNGNLYILDAGTGINELGAEFISNPGDQSSRPIFKPINAKLLISHAHGDHVQGLPLFGPAYVQGSNLEVYGPTTLISDFLKLERLNLERNGEDTKNLEKLLRVAQEQSVVSSKTGANITKAIFEVQQDPKKSKVFPIPVSYMAEGIHFVDSSKRRIVDHLSENGIYVSRLGHTAHPQHMNAFRFEEDQYVIFNTGDFEHGKEFTGPTNSKPVNSTKNDDRFVRWMSTFRDNKARRRILIGDGHCTPENYKSMEGWGHSHYQALLELAKKAGFGESDLLVVTHHDPYATDSIIRENEEMAKHAGRKLDIPVVFAQDGMTLDLSDGDIKVSDTYGCNVNFKLKKVTVSEFS